MSLQRPKMAQWVPHRRTGGAYRRTRGGNRTTPRSPLTPDQQAQLIQHASTQGFRTLREAVVWCREALSVVPLERQRRRVLEPLGRKRKVPRPMAVHADSALHAQ
jgi:hypothetical protein